MGMEYDKVCHNCEQPSIRWEEFFGCPCTLVAEVQYDTEQRIIKLLEHMPRTDNDRTVDAPTLIALIKGETNE